MNDAEGYHGFIRVGHGAPWQKICAASTIDLCWQLLLAHPVHVRGAVVERECLPAGESPPVRRSKRVRAEGKGFFDGGGRDEAGQCR